MKNRDHRNCIVTMPLGKSGVIPFSNLVNIVNKLSDELYLVTGGEGYDIFKNDEKIHVDKITHQNHSNLIMRIISNIKLQVTISRLLFQHRNNYNSVILFIGGESLILPSITVKILKKDLKIILAGFPMKIGKIKKDPLTKITGYLSNVVFFFSDKIIVYSNRIVIERRLQKYNKKIGVTSEHFIDLNTFKMMKPTYQRKLIGYVGTLSELKGVKNLIQAIEILGRDDLKFIFIGDGPLFDEMEEYINANSLNKKVMLKGWVSHDELPHYLNEFKLLVLPSYTEGLPNVLIEAMACGTPVLATNVGAIPDIIKDAETGFIIEKNVPHRIAKDINRVLEYEKIGNIISNAYNLIENNFTYSKVEEKWDQILE